MQTRKKHFTLFELLVSLSLLVVVLVVILRMLTMSSELWTHTNDQSNLYIDNKVAFNLLAEELASMVYNTAHNNENSFYAPLHVLQDSFDDAGVSINDDFLLKLYEDDSDYNYIDRISELCFVTHTKRGNTSEVSDICKVVYLYLPPLTHNAASINALYNQLDEDVIPGKINGVLLRAVIPDDGSVDHPFAGNQNINSYYNFDWDDVRQIAEGVIDFNVTTYNSGSVTRAVRVSMTMLPVERLEEFRRDYQDPDNALPGQKISDAQQVFLQKYSRTFVRTFWIRPLDAQN